MKKFEGILICTDLDGTLLKNDKTISRENLEAIEYFKSEGGKFTFITGRMPASVFGICEILKPELPFGCINGGGVYDYHKKEYLWYETISPRVLEVVEHIERHAEGIGYQVNTLDTIWFCRDNPAMQRFRALTGVPDLRCDYREIREPVAKVVFGDLDPRGILRIEELYYEHPLADQFQFISSEKTLCEILPKGVHKGLGLRKLSEILGVPRERTIGVGDYSNDVELLRCAGVGIAVENANDAAKAAADRITVSNESHAIAKIISDIESGEIRL